MLTAQDRNRTKALAGCPLYTWPMPGKIESTSASPGLFASRKGSSGAGGGSAGGLPSVVVTGGGTAVSDNSTSSNERPGTLYECGDFQVRGQRRPLPAAALLEVAPALEQPPVVVHAVVDAV